MKKILVLSLFIHLFLSGEVVHWSYGQQYKNYALNTDQPVGVLVTAFNRPDYFKKTLESLEQTPEAQTLPFFFIIDGGPRALQAEHAAIFESSSIKKKHLILLNQNYGNGRNVLDARRFMFEWCNFDKILVFEDDIVVTPEYITLTLRLHEWAQKNFDNVGAVSCYNDCFLDDTEKEKHLSDVEATIDKYWGYCMDRATHNDIKDLLDEFEQRYLIDTPVGEPNCALIGAWMMYHMKTRSHIKPTKRSMPSIIDYHKYFQYYIAKLQDRAGLRRDGQDMETRFSFFMRGKVKISTTVNRARYIGIDGTHHDDQMWQKNNLDSIILTRFSQDTHISTFKTVFDKLNRLKILFVMSKMPHAYITSLTYVIQHLVERGHMLHFLIHKHNMSTRSILNVLQNDLNFYDWNDKIFYGSLPKGYKNFDIIMSEFGDDSAVCLDLKKKGLQGKLVTVFNKNNIELFAHKYPERIRELAEWGDYFIPVSQYGKQKLVKSGLDTNRMTVSYQSVPRTNMSSRSRVPEKFAPIRLFIVSDLLPDKGLEYALYALASLTAHYRTISLTIVGTGPLLPELKALVASLQLTRQVHFIKQATYRELLDIMNESHVVLSPSANAMTNDDDIVATMVSAMELGLPIIATRKGGIAELIDDGVNGILISEHSSESIVKAVKSLLSNPRKIDEIGRAGKQKISSFLNTRKLCHEMEKTLCALCGGDDRKHHKQSSGHKK